MLAIYWETVARWMMMRAQRDAATLRQPLFLIQAADVSTPPMPVDLAAKLMNKPNPKDTGGMHSFLAVHLGMHMRLLDALDLDKGLVKDADGELARIAFHPSDEALVEAALAAGSTQIYLRHLPLGVWLKMKKYKGAPFCKQLQAFDGSLAPNLTDSLLFVEPRTAAAFTFRGHTVVRTGFPFSHGRVITCTACQGRTLTRGVVIDCGRHEGGATPKEDDDWWLELYVMLSRATCLNDLLLVRPPPATFLLRGPPANLKQQLEKFAARTEGCRATAAALAHELGLARFFHDP